MLSEETKAKIARHVPGSSRATGRLEKFGYDDNSKAIFEIVEGLLGIEQENELQQEVLRLRESNARWQERTLKAQRDRDDLRKKVEDHPLYKPLKKALSAAWKEGYLSGWDDRNKDEYEPLAAGEQHDTPNPYDQGGLT